MRSIWASVVTKRRAERARVGADRPGDHAAASIRSRTVDRVLVGPQPGRPHGSVAAGVVDHAVGGQRREPVAEAGADPLGARRQVLALDDRRGSPTPAAHADGCPEYV